MMGCSTPEHSTGKVILTENCLCSPEQTLQGAQGARLVLYTRDAAATPGIALGTAMGQPRHHQWGTNLPQKRLCSLGKVTECLNCGKLPSVLQQLHHHRAHEAQAREGLLSSGWSPSSGTQPREAGSSAPVVFWCTFSTGIVLWSFLPTEETLASTPHQVHGLLIQQQFPRSPRGIAHSSRAFPWGDQSMDCLNLSHSPAPCFLPVNVWND